MKISYRTHPIIYRLENKKLGLVNGQKEEFDLLTNNQVFFRERFAELCSEKFSFYCLTESFKDAYTFAGKRLLNSSLCVDVPSGSYCFIDSKIGFAIKIKNDTEIGCLDCEVFSIVRYEQNEKAPLLRYFGSISLLYDIDKNDDGNIRYAGFDGIDSTTFNKVEGNDLMTSVMWHVFLILFIKYAEVETKILPAGKKVKDIACKYLNETKSDVTILNSTWFTTLIKSDAFKVRGHFRLQPCGQAFKDKKLIWINDFEKCGYTAPARKLKQIPSYIQGGIPHGPNVGLLDDEPAKEVVIPLGSIKL